MNVSLKTKRTAYVDNLRLTLIIMVVLIHIAVTYSGLGSWYYKENAALDLVSMVVLFAYQIFAQAFFMGLLFFLAGVFVPRAYDKKGAVRFVRDRAVRLGIPIIVYALLVHPLIVFFRDYTVAGPAKGDGLARFYATYVGDLHVLSGTGPLWFALALLEFSAIYAVGRWIVEKLSGRSMAEGARPATVSDGGLVILSLLMAAVTFLVRIWNPIGTSWLNMQVSFFTQYVVLFVAGIWVGRHRILERLPSRMAMRWFRLAVFVGVPAWVAIMTLGGAFSGQVELGMGGLHWQSAVFSIWEQFFCVGVSAGLIVIYRDTGDTRSPFIGWLSDNAFGVYVFHAPVVVAVSLALRGLVFFPLGKAFIVAALAVPLSFLAAAAIRSTPVTRRLFS